MEFYKYQSLWDQARKDRLFSKRELASYENFYKAAAERAPLLPSLHMSQAAEILISVEASWYRCNRPYVKVYPAMAAYLGDTKIDIPTEFIRPAYPVVEVRLANDDSYSLTLGGGIVESMLVSFRDEIMEDKPIKIMMCTVNIVGCSESGGYQLVLPTGKTVQECLDDSENDPASYYWYINSTFKADLKILLSIGIAVNCFISGAHALVTPEISAKVIHRYHEAKKRGDEVAVAQLIHAAKAIGLGGWELGKEIELPRDMIIHHNKQKGDGTNQLRWGHMRSGHIRLQAIGSGEDRDHKLVFIMPTVVRPDLPMKPVPTGYKITDKVLPTPSM